jgi:hypothetical protein
MRVIALVLGDLSIIGFGPETTAKLAAEAETDLFAKPGGRRLASLR